MRGFLGQHTTNKSHKLKNLYINKKKNNVLVVKVKYC